MHTLRLESRARVRKSVAAIESKLVARSGPKLDDLAPVDAAALSAEWMDITALEEDVDSPDIRRPDAERDAVIPDHGPERRRHIPHVLIVSTPPLTSSATGKSASASATESDPFRVSIV